MFKALGLREGGRDHLGEDQSASAHNQDWQDWSLAQSWKGDILADENIPGIQFIISENDFRISFVFSGALFSGIERKYSLEPRLGL